jgi:hypothetical protein
MLVHGLLDLRNNHLLTEGLHRHALTGRHHFQLTRHRFRQTDNDILAQPERITATLAKASPTAPPPALSRDWGVPWSDVHGLPAYRKCQRIQLVEFLSRFAIKRFVFQDR